MNTKEIALAVNKSQRTIRNWINKLGENFSSIKAKVSSSTSTNPADYTLNETLDIIEIGLGKNARSLFEHSSQPQKYLVPKNQNINNDIEDRMLRLENLVEKLVEMQLVLMEHIQKQSIESFSERTKLKINARNEVNKKVRDYSKNSNVTYSTAWNMIYRELSYQLKTDLRDKASDMGLSIINYIEHIEKMEELLDVCDFILV